MRLENWRLIEMGCGNFVCRGEIYGDDKNRFNDGDEIITSVIQEINFTSKLLFTRNSIYELGPRSTIKPTNTKLITTKEQHANHINEKR